jgi:hypothetical protein
VPVHGSDQDLLAARPGDGVELRVVGVGLGVDQQVLTVRHQRGEVPHVVRCPGHHVLRPVVRCVRPSRARPVRAVPPRHPQLSCGTGHSQVRLGYQTWPGGDDYAGIDIFRVDDNGEIVEHRDVLQVISTTSAKDKGMF